MYIDANICELWYSIKFDPGVAVLWTELEGGFWDVYERGDSYDKTRTSINITDQETKIYLLHDYVRAAQAQNDTLTFTTADGECFCGSQFEPGVFTGKCEGVSPVNRDNLGLYSFKMDVLVFTTPVKKSVTPDFSLLPVPLSYPNSSIVDQKNFETIYPDGFAISSTGSKTGYMKLQTPAIKEARAAAIMRDITENIRGNAIQLPDNWATLRPFGETWSTPKWAFVKSVFETVKKLDQHIIKLEVIKDVR